MKLHYRIFGFVFLAIKILGAWVVAGFGSEHLIHEATRWEWFWFVFFTQFLVSMMFVRPRDIIDDWKITQA